MRGSGPDSLSSWVVACACCLINMMLYGMTRLSGVLFVASVPRFKVTRERAAFPYTFANFVRNTSGPLVGYAGHRLGVRPVTALGCLLAAVGVGTCCLAENIDVVTVLWGLVFGLGFGFGNILLPVAINEHFAQKRATASGISFSGACLGSFLLPPIVEQLLAAYGLSGTFLLLSGFVLQCLPAALLLWSPRKEEERRKIAAPRPQLYTLEKSCEDPKARPKPHPLGAFSVVLDPLFGVIAVTNGLYNFSFICIFTVIVDYARDLSVGAANEKYVLMAVSVGDLVGRLGLGWVTDGGYLSSVSFAALLFACQGAMIAAIPLCGGFSSLVAVSALYGLAEAGLIVIFPIIIGEYIAREQQTVAIPSSNFLSGPACLAIPPLIGFFRDHLGSYDFLFDLVAVLSFGCCFAWLWVRCTVRYHRKNGSF